MLRHVITQMVELVVLLLARRRAASRYVPDIEKEEYYEISVRSMNIDDRPTNHSGHIHTFWKILKWPYLSNASSDPIRVWFWDGFFGDGRPNSTIYFPVRSNPKWRLAAILKKIKRMYL